MRVSAFLLCVVCFGGCSPSKPAPETITVATTTSTQDSGLMDDLVPRFQRQTGITVKVVAVGTGQALELGRRGDADVLLTHAPQAEDRFMAEGAGSARWPVMFNDFVVVGPKSDPAGLNGASSVADAFARLAEQQARFVSRGDESGTHMKEQQIWQSADVEPSGDWYIRAGAGMAQALRIASEKQAYTLSDRGTFLAHHESLKLAVAFEGDAALQNHYSVMLVNAQKHPHVHERAARRFADFLRSDKTQQLISEFGTEEFGQPLFFPNAGPARERSAQGEQD